MPNARSFAGEDLADVLDHIVGAHHAYTRSELSRLRALAGELAPPHGRPPITLAKIIDLLDQLASDMLPHMDDEELVLFPYIVALEGAVSGPLPWRQPFVNAKTPISEVNHEHDRATRILHTLRDVTNDFRPPPGATDAYRALFEGLAALEADLNEHMRVETEEVFPRALALEASLRARERA